MFCCLRKRKSQTTLEYVVLIIAIMGACLAAGVYLKRGIQGRWRAAVDEVGEQYDPRATNTDITYSTSGKTNTIIYATLDPTTNEVWTFRSDDSYQKDSKTGASRIGAIP